MIVCKFGGTSLADATRIRRAAAIVLREKARRFVVVSAPGKRFEADEKITDLLLRAAEGDAAALETALGRFAGMAAQLRVDIERDLRKAAAEIPARGAEYAASRGEYLCALLLARYLHWEFVDAAEVIRLREGRADLELTYDLLPRRLKPLKNAVIPGFYGSDGAGTCAPSRAAVRTSPARWWRRRWGPASMRTGRTWTACSPPIRGWWKTFAACRRCATGKCACWPAWARRCCIRTVSCR